MNLQLSPYHMILLYTRNSITKFIRYKNNVRTVKSGSNIAKWLNGAATFNGSVPTIVLDQ